MHMVQCGCGSRSHTSIIYLRLGCTDVCLIFPKIDSIGEHYNWLYDLISYIDSYTGIRSLKLASIRSQIAPGIMKLWHVAGDTGQAQWKIGE